MTRFARTPSARHRLAAVVTAVVCVGAQLALPPRAEAAVGTSTASAGSALPPQMAAIQSFQPDLFTGRATTAIPIVVPPGRKGVQPSLGLTYSSTGPNSWVGMGWALDLGAIERSTKNGLPTYDDPTDLFTAAFAGVASELVKIPDGTYRAKDEGAFLQFQFLGVAGWEARDKAGTRYRFGQDAASQTIDPATGKAFRWALSQVLDVHGNSLTVTYTKDQGQLYPAQLLYTTNAAAGLPATSRVDFVLEPATRPDVLTSYRSGYAITTAKRLQAIEVRTLVSGAWSLVRRYELSYALSRRTSRSLLTSVAHVGSDGTSRLPATTFSYQDAAPVSYRISSTTGNSVAPVGWNIRTVAYGGIPNSTIYPYDSLPWNDPVVINAGPTVPVNGALSATVNADGTLQLSLGSVFSAAHAWTWIYVSGPSPQLITLTFTESIFVEDWQGLRTSASGASILLLPGWSKIHLTAHGGNPARIHTFGTPLKTLVEGVVPAQFQQAQLAGDVDGNGIADFVAFDSLTGAWTVALSKGDDFSPSSTWQPSFTSPFPTPVLGDWNADGKTDIAVFNSNANWRIGRSTGTSFQPDSMLPFNYGVGSPFSGDFNGDGRTDLGTVSADSPRFWRFMVATPSAFDSAGTFNLFLGAPSSLPLIGDFNGDGLTDVAALEGGTLTVALSTGLRFAAPTVWATGLPTTGDYSTADFNGDGLTDLARYDRTTTGAVSYAPSTGHGQFGGFVAVPVTFKTQGSLQVADVNGDGLADPMVFSDVTTGADLARSDGAFPDLLAAIANGLGATTAIQYQPSTSSDLLRAPGSGPTLPFVLPVVSQVTVDDGRGHALATTYRYQQGLYDAATREFRGFGQVAMTDPLGTVTTTRFSQDAATKGRPTEVAITDTQGHLWAKTLNGWSAVTLYPGVTFATLDQTDQLAYNGDATFATTRTRVAYDTAIGEATTVFEDGDPGTTADDRRTETQYVVNSAAWLVKPKLVQTYTAATGGTLMAQRRFTYDGAATVDTAPTKGDLTKEEVWLDATGAWLATSLAYDSAGNVTAVTDALQRTTTNTYDAAGIYLAQIANPLGHTRRFVYDERFGQVRQATDQNGLVTSTTFDAFGRVTAVYGPNDALNPNVRDVYAPGSPISTTTVCARVQTGAPTEVCSRTFTDGLGRTIQVRSQAEDPAKDVVTGSIDFDARGQVATQWTPYLETTSSGYVSPVGNTALAQPVAYDYDVLGRLTKTTDAAGTTTTAYDDRQVTLTDANGHATRRTVDAVGRLVSVEELNGAATYTTTYAYDALSHLTQVRDHAGNVTTMAYDSLGRKTSLTDPDMGRWTYAYDAVDNLTSQTDARGVVTAFTYDALNRLTAKTSTVPANSGIPNPGMVSYNYDNIEFQFSKGRLSKVTDGSGWTEFEYDTLGRLITETKSVDGAQYQVIRAYDLLGRVTALTYPDGEQAAYTYNRQGGIETIALAAQTLVSGIDYNAADEITKIVYGNGVTTDYTYNPQTLRLEQLVSTSPTATTLQRFSYTYDPAGNVTAIGDAVHTGTQSFQYDALNRLTQAAGSYGTQTYRYDPTGNLLEKEGLQLAYPSAGQARPHAVTGATGGAAPISLTYDANGNVATKTDGSGTRTLTFDAENRLAQVSEGQQVTTTLTLTFKPGWNFFSLPVAPSNLSVASIFPTFAADFGQLSRYDAASKTFTHYVGVPGFDDFTSLQYGVGYQLYCKKPGGATVTLTGARPSGTTVSLAAGWHLLPAFALAPAPAAQVFSGLDVEAVQGYDAGVGPAGSLTTAATVQPGQAYYVKLRTATGAWPQPVPAAVNVSFTYDGDGGRVKKTTSAGTTVYIGDLYERSPSLVKTKYVFAGSLRVAAKSSDGKLVYYHPDHLGSSNLVTDAAAAVAELTEHRPFGDVARQEGPTRVSHQFTGQRQDDVPGLILFPGRVYDVQVGRFLQPDPFVQAPADPQTLNRYSYCRNNPLTYIDPSGYSFWRTFLRVVAVTLAVFAVVVTAGAAAPAVGAAIGLTEAAIASAGAIATTSLTAASAAYYASNHLPIAQGSGAAVAEAATIPGQSPSPTGSGPFTPTIPNPGRLADPIPDSPQNIPDTVPQPNRGIPWDVIPEAPGPGMLIDTAPENLGQMYNALKVSGTPKPTEDAEEEDVRSERDKKKDREKKHNQSSPADQSFIARLVKELHLTRPEREKLHRKISHRQLSEDEIRAMAEEIRKYGSL